MAKLPPRRGSAATATSRRSTSSPTWRSGFGFKPGDFPVCEYVSAQTLALPFFGNLTPRQLDRVCTTLEKVLEATLVGRKGRFWRDPYCVTRNA